MSLNEIIDHFRARNVAFKLKSGSTRIIFVNEIENEDDDQPELLFMADNPEDDVWISEVVSAKAID